MYIKNFDPNVKPKEKPFTTLEQQIEILKSRNLSISSFDIKIIENQLLKSTYYNVINSCGYLFKVQTHRKRNEKLNGKKSKKKKTENFVTGTTFNQIYTLHQVEVSFKNRIMKELLKIEYLIKSVVIYVFNENHQELDAYLNPNNFNTRKNSTNGLIEELEFKIKRATDLFESLKSETNKNKIINLEKKISNNAIASYLKNHKELPIWIIAKEMDFGNIKWFYDHMNIDEQNEVCQRIMDIYNFNWAIPKDRLFKLKREQFSSHLTSFKEIRNKLAHNNNILFYRGENFKKHNQLYNKYNIKSTGNVYKIYDIVISMELYMNTDDYRQMTNSLKKLIRNIRKDITAIDTDIIVNEIFGFPKGYEEPKKPSNQKLNGGNA